MTVNTNDNYAPICPTDGLRSLAGRRRSSNAPSNVILGLAGGRRQSLRGPLAVKRQPLSQGGLQCFGYLLVVSFDKYVLFKTDIALHCTCKTS